MLKEYLEYSNPCDVCLDEKCGGKHTCNCKECKVRIECPKYLHAVIRITNRCTQKCSHCCFNSSPQSDIMMSIEMAKDIASFLKNNKVYDFYLRPNSSEYERTFSTEKVIGIPDLDAEIEISEEEYNTLKGLYDTMNKNAVEMVNMFNSIDFTEQWQGITVDEVGDFSFVDLGNYDDDATIKEVIGDNVNRMSEWTARLQKLCGQFICLSHPSDNNKFFMRLDEVYVNESKHYLKGLILEYNSSVSNGISIRYDSRILNTDIGIVGEDEELYNAINDYMDVMFKYQEEYKKCIDNHIIKQNLDW